MAQSVLLIEDEPHIAEALSFLMQREGLNVSTHNDGADASDEILKTKPDLVILDVMLPNKSGMQILQEVRNIPDIAQTPVLMLTAKGQTKDRKAAESAGVSLFMTKPFSNAEIIENVRKLLQQPGA